MVEPRTNSVMWLTLTQVQLCDGAGKGVGLKQLVSQSY